MGYFKELLNRPVERPPVDLAVVDRNRIYQQSVVMIIDRTKNSFAKFNVKYKGENGIKYYKGKNKQTKHVFYTLEGNPIFNIQGSHFGKTRKVMYFGKDKGKTIGQIKSRHSPAKYKLTVRNLITDRDETLEMNSDKRLVVCGIFYGKEKEGAPLICKIKRASPRKSKCTIEIAPGTDNEFMMGLAAFFADMYDYRNKNRNATVAKMGHFHKGHFSDDSSSDESGDDSDNDGDDNDEYAECGYANFCCFDVYDGDCGDCDGGDGGDGGDCGGDGGGD